ncbi:Oidioi.mRNA.OKI2018_I69.chr1.g1443.t1.cds [Oikopleura dioica]|uniref:Oidioi.mRNA.OKI2018_I69.chr1.g1443.t1.cds n=1 Tax=Oikopleura dioica TaxID=34765 RepID=A0ABN7SRR2_OIKDI|nr:Oidioi.mRNA.OKI2018_I69.chr1.g1443.t1.cds [Oikopleura dioica]
MRDFTKFWALFNAVEALSTKPQIYGNCGGNYAGVYGTVASPGFPLANYPKNSACKWTVEVPKGMIVEVDMEWMDLEPDPSGCNFDFLAFYDQGTKRRKENTFCGSKPIFPIISKSNQFTIEFGSDGNEEKSGFALRWMAVEPAKEIFNCDFEQGTCLGWDLTSMGISAEEENFYAVAELDLSPSNTSSTSFTLVSPTVWPTATDNCFTFQVRPGSLDSLQVIDSSGIELYSQKVELDRGLENWSLVSVPLPRVVEPVHIRIKGEHRGDSPVPAALDDFNLDFQKCPILREDKPPCGLGLYRCQSGKNCIPTEYICDGVKDCFHGDDEVSCQKLEIPATLLFPTQLGPQLPPQALHQTPPLKKITAKKTSTPAWGGRDAFQSPGSAMGRKNAHLEMTKKTAPRKRNRTNNNHNGFHDNNHCFYIHHNIVNNSNCNNDRVN